MGIPLALQIGASFLQAGITSAVAKGQASAANQQLRVDMRNERIKGMQDANARQEEYLRNESANRVAASAAVGGGRNISFNQGVSPYNKEVARRDLQTLGYNTDQRIARGKGVKKHLHRNQQRLGVLADRKRTGSTPVFPRLQFHEGGIRKEVRQLDRRHAHKLRDGQSHVIRRHQLAMQQALFNRAGFL